MTSGFTLKGLYMEQLAVLLELHVVQPFLFYGFAFVNFLRPPIRYRHLLAVDTVIRPSVNNATFYLSIRTPPSI